MPFFELGSLTVALTFLILSIFAIVGIVLPLVRSGARTSGKANVVLYFGGLGAGYMFVEIGLLLSAHAWLGSPVLAAAVVITVLLTASGIGSVWSEHWSAGLREQKRTLLLIVSGITAIAVILFTLAPIAQTWPIPLQLSVLVFLISPVGAVMGMAFPLGLRRVENAAPRQVPWAWAINGCISVATPAAAMLLAINTGFLALFIAAAIAYGMALLSTVFALRTAGIGLNASEAPRGWGRRLRACIRNANQRVPDRIPREYAPACLYFTASSFFSSFRIFGAITYEQYPAFGFFAK